MVFPFISVYSRLIGLFFMWVFLVSLKMVCFQLRHRVFNCQTENGDHICSLSKRTTKRMWRQIYSNYNVFYINLISVWTKPHNINSFGMVKSSTFQRIIWLCFVSFSLFVSFFLSLQFYYFTHDVTLFKEKFQ